MSMGLLVFGRTLQNFIQSHFPLIAPFTGYVIQLRQLWGAAILLIFFLGIYCLVPDQKESVKVALPGAVFSTTGWMLFSLAFSLYFNFTGGKNYSYMYGSLAAIALSFLWLYICMCILFMGAELNWFWDEIQEVAPLLKELLRALHFRISAPLRSVLNMFHWHIAS